MAGEIPPVEPGLHLVATPIGAARDITLRALDVLARADVLAAEDTRNLRHLMALHGLETAGREIVAYHDHNGPRMRPRLLEALEAGKSVAYASDAGTPLVADPGYQLAREAIGAGHRVIAAPGPSAALAALTVSGLPSDRFLFAGFAPAQGAARKKFLHEMGTIPATVILFESPKRICRLLTELCEAWGQEREAALCRELTKRHEEVRRGTLGALAQGCTEHPPRGEIVLVIDRARETEATRAAASTDMEDALRERLQTRSLKQAVAEITAETGLPRRQVYQAALRLEQGT
ncbi:16S rRNA (cytidine(1402)-2'-O)-methyltransferase [Alkalilacustris brevis]|uniref:16S rRNA (cytidine(1402)-2'-O)-methyltransferase n=1 Tax=Alkalilacustris brevis TaxID=2026338 RepID=UPI000E0D2560|nr:16S rRNA (cytidine(1402)-2'-O)-methyltransferase [Alkalilacustris brevis]